MSKRSEYEKTMEETLDLYNARVETLRTHAGEDTKTEDLKRVEELATAGVAATAVLTKLKGTTGDAWDTVKAGLETSGAEIEAALATAEAAGRARQDRTAGRSSPPKLQA